MTSVETDLSVETDMGSPSAAEGYWRRVVGVGAGVLLVVVAAVLAFAWPAARIAPRDLPVGVIGTSPTSQRAVEALQKGQPGAFHFTLYADTAAARTAIRHRDVYGAFDVTPGGVTVLEAGAASPTVAQLLTGVGERLSPGARTVDVVPLSADDPKGVTLSSALLPLTLCGSLLAGAVMFGMRRLTRWPRAVALLAGAALAGGAVFLVAQGFLGALPHDHVRTVAALSLTLLALAAPAAGAISRWGPRGMSLVAPLMVIVGNPFSGATSAPQMLPTAVDRIGQWLPPGAGAGLLRSTAYFDGHGAAGPVTVLALWAVAGMTLLVVTSGRVTRLATVRPVDGDRARYGSAAEPVPDTTGPDAAAVPLGRKQTGPA